MMDLIIYKNIITRAPTTTGIVVVFWKSLTIILLLFFKNQMS